MEAGRYQEEVGLARRQKAELESLPHCVVLLQNRAAFLRGFGALQSLPQNFLYHIVSFSIVFLSL